MISRHPVQSDPLKRPATSLLRDLLRFAHREHFWRADGEGGGPYKANGRHNPYPVRGRNTTRRFKIAVSRPMLVAHLTGRRSLHLSNDALRDVWEFVIDIDHKQGNAFAPLESQHFAREVNRQWLGGRGWVEPSRRGQGAYLRFRVERTGTDAAEAIRRVKALEARLREAHGAGGTGPVLEAIKGIPVLAVANEEYDEALAGSPGCILSYFCNHDWLEWGWERTEQQHYDYYKEHYRERFHPLARLERWKLRIDRHASAPAPCCHQPGDDIARILGKLERYASWSASAVPFAVHELDGLCPAGGTPELEPSPKPKRGEANAARGERLARLFGDGDESDARPPRRLGMSEIPPGIAEMIGSDDKVRQTDGVAFLSLRMTGGRFEPELAHDLYERLVARGRPRDAQREARVNSAGRWAEGNFEVRSRGDRALAALERQSGTPGWFTEQDVEEVTARLRERVTRGELGTTSHRAVAVAYLILRKNIYLGQHGLAPRRVSEWRTVRDRLRRLCGMRDLGGEGVEVPTRAIRRALEHFGLRRSGRAIADAVNILVELEAIVCSSRSYQSGVFDEHGRKVAAGYCRRYQVGAAALLGGGGAAADDRALHPRVSFSQAVCGPAGQTAGALAPSGPLVGTLDSDGLRCSRPPHGSVVRVQGPARGNVTA
jgi:hypothetical protein